MRRRRAYLHLAPRLRFADEQLLTFLCGSRVNLTEDGRQAILKLSRGDMRRALNVLQVRNRFWGRYPVSADTCPT